MNSNSDIEKLEEDFNLKKDADEGVIIERPTITNLPAVESVARHPLLEGKNFDYLQPLAEEIELDEKLGLENQKRISQAQILRNDINELTKSNNYYQVTERGLEKLFKIKELKNKCSLYNTAELFASIWAQLKISAYSLTMAMCLWFLAFQFAKWPLFVCASIVSIFCLVYTIVKFVREDVELSFQKMVVDLKTENIKSTTMKMPKGVKCKIEEAKETEIFKDFMIAYPDVRLETHTVVIPRLRFRVDPAIVAISHDGRMYMVVYWDIKNDIDRTVDQIEKIKKFKLDV